MSSFTAMVAASEVKVTTAGAGFAFTQSTDHPIPFTCSVAFCERFLPENSWSIGPVRRDLILDQLWVVGDIMLDELDAITPR